MSSLTKVLAEEVRKIEETAAVARTMQTNRLTHHLMPPVGWLNDPTGLCGTREDIMCFSSILRLRPTVD